MPPLASPPVSAGHSRRFARGSIISEPALIADVQPGVVYIASIEVRIQSQALYHLARGCGSKPSVIAAFPDHVQT